MEGDFVGYINYDTYYAISIHTLRVEGDYNNALNALTNRISIHTLRVEGDFF